MLCHTDLLTYYKNIFAMVQHHKYSIEELETLIPYERDIYMDLLLQWIEQKKEEDRRNNL